MRYKIVFLSFLISLNLFSSQCEMDLVMVNSGAENALDYEVRKNYKYAIIELNEAIIYAKQAVDDCQSTLKQKDIDKLKERIKSFSERRDYLKKRLR